MSAYEELSHALTMLEDTGQSWPCRGSDLWISEDPTEREQGATACQGCQVLDLCAEAARETKSRWGVWAGVDLTPTTKPRKAVA